MNADNRDDAGAIGIGAMIVFIALILVAAVASAVIIQTAEKLQQNAQQTGDDTTEEIGGKISILTIYTAQDADAATGGNQAGIVIIFELAPGSELMADTSVDFQLLCNDAGTLNQVDGDASASTTLDGSAVTTLDAGTTYKLVVDTDEGAGNDECDPTADEEHTLFFHVTGGGSTYEVLKYGTTVTAGTVVV